MGEPETNRGPKKGPKATVTKIGGRSRRLYAKVAGLVLALLVVIALVVAGVLYIVHRSDNSETSTKRGSTSTPHTVTGFILSDDTKGALSLLDEQIAAAKTDTDKGALYQRKAAITYGVKDYADALKYAQQAEKLHGTVESASLIGDIGMAQNNKSLALKYYKLQLERMGTVENQDTLKTLQQKIVSAGGTI